MSRQRRQKLSNSRVLSAAEFLLGALIVIGYNVFHVVPNEVLVVDSGVAGLILGAAYLLSGRNLWASILAHGLIDTVGSLLWVGLIMDRIHDLLRRR